MRAIYIIVEGQTEEEFINNVLCPFFQSKGIYDVRAIPLETSSGHKGGDLKYDRLKPNALRFMKHEKDIIVTSLIDFYKIKNDFPKFVESKSISNKLQQVIFLETAISEDINNHRFIPYIQLHEFEGLLFSAKRGFEYFPGIPKANKDNIFQIIESYPNPELINDGLETHPSKRLENLIPGYEKPLHGPIIALENGIHSILEKCPRFKGWVELLISNMQP